MDNDCESALSNMKVAKLQGEIENLRRELARREEAAVSAETQIKNREMESAALRTAEETARRELDDRLCAQAEIEAQIAGRLSQQEAILKESALEERRKLEAAICILEARAEKLSDHEALAATELLRERDILAAAMKEKSLKEVSLQVELSALRADRDEATSNAALGARQSALDNLSAMLESELSCSICYELMYEATALNCSHTFCKLCIEQWLKQSKDCPQCRCTIRSQTRALVIDSYIDKAVEHLSSELQEKRKTMISERNNHEPKYSSHKSERSSLPGVRRGGRSIRERVDTSYATRSRMPTEPVVISSTESSSSSESDSQDSNYVPTISNTQSSDSRIDINNDTSSSDTESQLSIEPMAYYGGYGRCFSCGRRGHWSNGCPFS